MTREREREAISIRDAFELLPSKSVDRLSETVQMGYRRRFRSTHFRFYQTRERVRLHNSTQFDEPSSAPPPSRQFDWISVRFHPCSKSLQYPSDNWAQANWRLLSAVPLIIKRFGLAKWHCTQATLSQPTWHKWKLFSKHPSRRNK